MTHEVRFVRRRNGRRETLPWRVEEGTTLLEAARSAGLPVASACSGGGLCARCGLEILEGRDSLSEESEEEREAKRRNRIPAGWRLACQALVRGPLSAAASYW